VTNRRQLELDEINSLNVNLRHAQTDRRWTTGRNNTALCLASGVKSITHYDLQIRTQTSCMKCFAICICYASLLP